MKVLRNIAYFCILITISTLACSCSLQPSIEDIYKEQQSTTKSNTSEKVGTKISEKILNNINGNDSMGDAIDVAKEKNKAKEAVPADVTKTASEQIDAATVKMNNGVWGGLINFLMALQKSAVIICIIMILLGGLLGYLFRKDWTKLKKCIFLGLGGPIFFLIIVYLPAILWYIVQ